MRFISKHTFALFAACLPAATAAAQPCQGVWSDAFAWGGVTGSSVKIQSMIVYNDGSGDAIFIAGDNTELFGGTALTKVARFDGNAWTDADAGLSDVVLDFEVFDDGTGPAL